MRSLIIFLLTITTAYAGIDPQPLATDSRVRVIPYDRNNVTQLKCHYDVETTVEYAPDEVIMRASAGQAAAWTVLPSQSHRNILTIRPVTPEADTNLTVLTNKRVYLYELKARKQWDLRSKDITFYLRYIYPHEANMALERRAAAELEQTQAETQARARRQDRDKVDPASINLDYEYAGDNEIAPLSVFDDGQFTYFKFDQNTDLPAIYTVDRNRNESILNYRIKPPYVVIERLANRFTLRSGDQVVTVQRKEPVIKTMQAVEVSEKRPYIAPEW